MNTSKRRIRKLPSWIGPHDLMKIKFPIKPGCGIAQYEDGRPVKRFTAPKNAIGLGQDCEGWYWVIERKRGEHDA